MWYLKVGEEEIRKFQGWVDGDVEDRVPELFASLLFAKVCEIEEMLEKLHPSPKNCIPLPRRTCVDTCPNKASFSTAYLELSGVNY